MLQLTGNNLGERQKELNVKVNEAASKKTDFDEVKTQTESSDVDRLFKIDLASKYRNVEYILEVLKCGDSLYISRALKCIWLYDDEYSNVINPEYLHLNMFPFMSLKMKKKLLSTISLHVTNERAIIFYQYCMTAKFVNIAFRFLIFTTESFKLQILNEIEKRRMIQNRGNEYVKNFIGNSFLLAQSYIHTFDDRNKKKVICELSYFYSVSAIKYLELLEKNYKLESYDCSRQLGLRISKDIIKNHKDRIRKKPILYLSIIKKHMLAKQSTKYDAEFYAKALLTVVTDSCRFWQNILYGNYKHIIDLIPSEERIRFLKNIYTERFKNEEFELNIHFYKVGYYKLMTVEEREAWALQHIERNLDLHGLGRDFIWYKFVCFEKAFVALRKYIMITINPDTRAEIINVLLESAKTDQELEKLFNYYYERHINEQHQHKEMFVDTVLKLHNIFNFSESCWTVLNKLFYSMEVYSESSNYWRKNKYRYIALIYSILHLIDLTDNLKQVIDSGIHFYSFKKETDKLSEEKQDIVYQYLFKIYLEKFHSLIKNSENKEWSEVDENVKEEIIKCIHYLLQLITQYKKSESSVPESVIRYMNLEWDEFKHYLIQDIVRKESLTRTLTQELLLRSLKRDIRLVLAELPNVKDKVEDMHCPRRFRLTKFLKKIKIYFANDVAMQYFLLFTKILSNPELSKVCAKYIVHGIFLLADYDFKIEFMTKYAPTEPKIDHSKIDQKLLHVQAAICSLSYYSRPPIPLTNVLMYIKGDYVHFCLPIFNSYLANLPLPLCIEFVKSILDAPLSVQKHSIRLAFQCFNADDLKNLIVYVWKRTKNVSLRTILYKVLFNKILESDEQDQTDLFKVLKTLTLDLHKDDDKDSYGLLTSVKLPSRFINDYLEAAWMVVNKLPEKPSYIEYRSCVVTCIKNNMNLIEKDFLQPIIDEHLKFQIEEEHFHSQGNCLYNTLVRAKWELTKKYLVFNTREEAIEHKIKIMRLILNKCFKLWNLVERNVYVVRQFFYGLIGDLENESYNHDVHSYSQANLIFLQILKYLENVFREKDIYINVWELKLSILTRKIITDAKLKIINKDYEKKLMGALENVTNFTTQFMSLVNEYREKRCFFTSFFDDIISVFFKYAQRLLGKCDINISKYKVCDVCVLLCNELVEIQTFETYMFVLKILPDNYANSFLEKYKSIINKIMSFENDEIQFYMCKKFASNFKYRECLHPNVSLNKEEPV